MDRQRLDALRLKVRAGRPLVILDDVLATGESAVTLALSLRWSGVEPTAIAAGLASGNRYASEQDLRRLYERLQDRPVPTGYSNQELRRDIETFFGPYPRWKIGQFARDLGWNRALRQDPALALRYIRSGAENLDRIRRVLTREFRRETGRSWTPDREIGGRGFDR